MAPNPAGLTKQAVEIPDPEVHDARVNEDAVGPEDQVRCVIPDHTEEQTTDPFRASGSSFAAVEQVKQCVLACQFKSVF